MRTTRHPSPTRVCARMLLAGIAAALLLGGTATVAAAATATGPQVTQQLAVLLSGRRVYREPRVGSPLLTTVSPERPITGEATALPVIARARSAGGVRWLRVMLPGRPNGSSGWITQQGTRMGSTPWRLRIDLSRRRITVYRAGIVLRSFLAVIGKPSTPTPTGNYFVEETLQMRSGEPGGPFALALSARSDALQEFEGGPGQIAIHGRDNLGGNLGSAESHGCVRVGTTNIDWLAFRIGPGVPVTIVGA
jgi:lipoprotein-anchoring transpeptidase ErfK/SrfK